MQFEKFLGLAIMGYELLSYVVNGLNPGVSVVRVIVRVRVVLKRTVVGDWRFDSFDNLSGSHLQSQVNSICQSMML